MTTREELLYVVEQLEELIGDLGLLARSLRRMAQEPEQADFDYHTGMPPKK